MSYSKLSTQENNHTAPPSSGQDLILDNGIDIWERTFRNIRYGVGKKYSGAIFIMVWLKPDSQFFLHWAVHWAVHWVGVCLLVVCIYGCTNPQNDKIKETFYGHNI